MYYLFTSRVIAGVITSIAVGISIVSAFPWVRNAHHKYVNYRTTFGHGLINVLACLRATIGS